MEIPWRVALIVMLGAFVVFLIAKLIPFASRGPKQSQELNSAKVKARASKDPIERANALCDAAEASLRLPFGAGRAGAYFLRAMRAAPTSSRSVERAISALSKRRARLLEKVLWRRLAATPWDADHEQVTVAIVKGLVVAFKGRRGHAAHERFFSRIVAGEVLRVSSKE